MKKNNEAVIGILGGLGPYATLDIFKKIIDNTPVTKDCGHFRIIIDNNPKIPSRTKAVMNNGEDPGLAMIKTAQNLERAGADFIIIPCNSAHYWIDNISKKINIPILNMIQITSDWILAKYPEIKKIGLLAGTVVYEKKLYNKYLLNKKILFPNPSDQLQMINQIHEIKKKSLNKTKKEIKIIIDKLIRKGAKLIILGCTELPLVIKNTDYKKIIFVDPALILAKYIVNKFHKNEILY